MVIYARHKGHSRYRPLKPEFIKPEPAKPPAKALQDLQKAFEMWLAAGGRLSARRYRNAADWQARCPMVTAKTIQQIIESSNK